MEISEEFKDRVDFLTIYIKEAHPEDEWKLTQNSNSDICYLQPKNLKERIGIAKAFIDNYNYPIPLTIDNEKDEGSELYSAWPERLYVIEKNKIAYKGGVGPLFYRPKEVRKWLEKRFNQGN